MIVLIKLILAHFIGDFLLQPKSWVADKELHKASSRKLYLHVFIHGFLILLLLWDFDYWHLALFVMISHGVIDTIKIYAQKENNKGTWFLIDQGLHVVSLFMLWVLFVDPDFQWTGWVDNQGIWIYSTALLFLTVVSAMVMQSLMSAWSGSLTDNHEDSLNNAGKYIGILERLFVFIFVVTGHWEGIGFLLAAKSVFRFGDLKESKSRKLTEYILIGTLLSFGIAILTGMATLWFIGMS
tara:strand:+ start:10110 stop:10826 length:717 start_codon:yes stop_codon:yes gene_type:complete